MMNEPNILSEEKVLEKTETQVNSSSTNEALKIILPAEKKLTAPPQKETSTDKWIMPPEQHGYIQPNENDCF